MIHCKLELCNGLSDSLAINDSAQKFAGVIKLFRNLIYYKNSCDTPNQSERNVELIDFYKNSHPWAFRVLIRNYLCPDPSVNKQNL
jgi:hypothetical protein